VGTSFKHTGCEMSTAGGACLDFPPFPREGNPLHTATPRILASQHGVLLDPDDRLGEVQARGLQHRRIVAEVRIAAQM
jgi:hypothetical protein